MRLEPVFKAGSIESVDDQRWFLGEIDGTEGSARWFKAETHRTERSPLDALRKKHIGQMSACVDKHRGYH